MKEHLNNVSDTSCSSSVCPQISITLDVSPSGPTGEDVVGTDTRPSGVPPWCPHKLHSLQRVVMFVLQTDDPRPPSRKHFLLVIQTLKEHHQHPNIPELAHCLESVLCAERPRTSEILGVVRVNMIQTFPQTW